MGPKSVIVVWYPVFSDVLNLLFKGLDLAVSDITTIIVKCPNKNWQRANPIEFTNIYSFFVAMRNSLKQTIRKIYIYIYIYIYIQISYIYLTYYWRLMDMSA